MNRNLIRWTDASFTEWQRALIFERKRHGKWEEAPDEVTGPIRELRISVQVDCSFRWKWIADSGRSGSLSAEGDRSQSEDRESSSVA